MKRWSMAAAVAVLTAALAPASAWALERSFPPESVECELTGNGFPSEAWISTKAGRHAAGPAMTARDANNRFITLGQIPKKALARCVFDASGGLARVWLLNAEEARSFGSGKK